MGWLDRLERRLVALGADAAQLAALELLAQTHGELALASESVFVLDMGAGEPDATGATPEGTLPKEVQIFREGQWLEYPRDGGLSLTPAMFAECVANHTRYKTDPVIDREHESVNGWDATPARGWVHSLRVGPAATDPVKQALFGTVSWTPPGADDIKQRLFRYVSGGVYLKAKDRATGAAIGARLDHIAICKKPFIEGMEPLTNSLTPRPAQPAKGTNVNLKLLAVWLGLGESADEAAVLSALKDKEPLIRAAIDRRPAALLSAASLAVLKLPATATGAELDARIAELARAEGESTTLGARIAKLEDDKLVAEVDTAISEFRCAPAERDVQLESARGNPALWRRVMSARVPAPPAGNKVNAALRPRGAGAEDTTLDAKRAAQMAAIEAHQKANPGMSYGDAVRACSAAKPELFNDGGA